MPTPRTSKARRKPAGRKPARRKASGNVLAGSKPTQNAVRRKTRTQRTAGTPRAGTQATAKKSRARRHAAALPGWRDLAAANERVAGTPRAAARLDRVSTGRFVLLLAAVAVAFTMYVGHVHATQQLLADVQQARHENMQLHLKLNRLKGAFDRATGPAVIYQRARTLGLEEDITYGPTIQATEAP